MFTDIFNFGASAISFIGKFSASIATLFYSKDSRELIITYASALNHCDFGYNGHKVKSAESGINEVIIEQLKTNIDSANVDEKLKPGLCFVKKLTLNPGEITSEDAQYIFDAGWDEQTFLESVCLCAIANCMNRFAMGIGTDAIGTRNFLLDKACEHKSPRQLQ